ncbi:AraC family transcriptional regulator [Sphingomonas metalli]|uniref:AraC family transcriptional regulator n=1 Tax=Sphingomonas metalli TaxID=1779358 RepID=A0A916TEE9_9SPHN|nr:AraC family transcriptional regulator [Sphingomonas metalli]GGB41387.1 AraC family transcriptional regulator [Sphingomonas metalli]
MDLVFGWRTAVLSVAAAVLLPLAAALSTSLRNRLAARTLAALLVVMTGVFVPWLIGFAGFYDRWWWLTFAPFANALFVPPLLWLHARALTDRRWPRGGWRHLLPGAVQFTYQTIAFLLPLPLKRRWAEMSFSAGDMLLAVLLAISFAVYGTWTLRRLRLYRHALAQERSDDARFATAWLARTATVFPLLALVWAGHLLVDAVTPLGYAGLMPLYVAIAGFALYLGISGWRYLVLPFPTLDQLRIAAAPPPPTRDWHAQGRVWAARTREAGWYREEALTLRQLAGRLGSNESYVSRALNEGLGIGFSDFINSLRCEEVAALLAAGDGRGLLEIALETGFASKASFNRAFQRRYGQSPSAYRASHRT